jgi:hypothetical protein
VGGNFFLRYDSDAFQEKNSFLDSRKRDSYQIAPNPNKKYCLMGAVAAEYSLLIVAVIL